MMAKLDKIEARAAQAKGGMDGYSKRGYHAICKIWDQKFRNKGMRAEGGGRKWHFKAHTEYLKRWHEMERMRSHSIDKFDLKDEWMDRLEIDIKVLQASTEKFTKMDKLYLEKMQEKLEVLKNGTPKAIEAAIDRMAAKIGGRMNTPSRAADLSPYEEQIRCHLTWQNFDERLWLAGCAEQDELRHWVADAQKFVEDREDTWLVFSDQIPLWVKIGLLKILYAEFEIVNQKSQEKSQKVRKDRLAKMRASRGQDSQKIEPAAPQEEEDGEEDQEVRGKKRKAGEMHGGGMSQKRGSDASGDRCRITFEARQAVKGFFGKDPNQIRGMVLDSVVVLKGGYAQLSNIDDDHRFKEDVEFYVGEKKIHHKKGKKTQLMYNLVELRKEKPEIFKGLVIFQQPSAWMDEIIQSWCCQDLGERCPQCVHQRDLFSAALTDTVKKIMAILHQIPSWIAAKMTPCLQLTDTDFAFPLKKAVTRAKAEMARDMRKRARLQGQKESFKCGLEEMIRMCQIAHVEMVEMNAKGDLVCRGIRRNAMAQFRPNVEKKKFEDCDLDERFADMPVGSHRLKDEWLADRKTWLDDKGRPKSADWSQSEHAREMADLQEHDYCKKEKEHQKDYSVKVGGQEIQIPVIDVDCDEQDLFKDHDAWMSLHPKLRRELKTKFAGKRTEMAIKARAAQKRVEREKVKMAVSSMQEDWKEWVSEAMISQCRKDLVKSVLPQVKAKTKGRKEQVKLGAMGKASRKEVVWSRDKSFWRSYKITKQMAAKMGFG